MKKVAVIYWSQTGNTQQMAQLIAQGALEGGAQVECMPVSSLTPEQALEYDGLALGCPAMGAEVLEEAEFDPFFTQLEGHLQGRTLAIFGSYGWGDGEWMRPWQNRCAAAGASLVGGEGLAVCGTPAGEDEARCIALGKALA